jgi:hypothetical protein
VTPPNLAVADDRQPRGFLILQRQPHGVVLRLAQLVSGQAPRGAEHVGLGQPGGLGQTADD